MHDEEDARAADARIEAFVLTIQPPEGMRRKHAEMQLEALGWPWEAVTGPDRADDAILAEYSPFKNLLLNKRNLTRSEIACYVGHRRMWRRIVDRKLDFALIFEDDFFIPDQAAFRNAVADCLAHPERWDMVKFCDYHPKPIVIETRFGGTRVVAHKYVPAVAAAYLVSSEAARRLLERPRVFRPVDEDFAYPWEFGLRIWSVSPNPATEMGDQLGGSQIAGDRRANRKSAARTVWANILTGWKSLRAYSYRRRMAANA